MFGKRESLGPGLGLTCVLCPFGSYFSRGPEPSKVGIRHQEGSVGRLGDVGVSPVEDRSLGGSLKHPIKCPQIHSVFLL